MKDDALGDAICEDYRTAKISDSDRAMLDYAVRLTESPADIKEADLHNLCSFGFDDRALHDIAAITAYFNYVNRLVDGLGVELEEDMR